MALELDQPILLAVAHGTVVHGDDERSSQQGPGRPAAHHGAEHRLAVVHRGPAGAQREKKGKNKNHKTDTPFSGNVTLRLAAGYKHSTGGKRRGRVPHVVLPLNRHVHLVHPALRNRPRRNQQTHPWGGGDRQNRRELVLLARAVAAGRRCL